MNMIFLYIRLSQKLVKKNEKHTPLNNIEKYIKTICQLTPFNEKGIGFQQWFLNGKHFVKRK